MHRKDELISILPTGLVSMNGFRSDRIYILYELWLPIGRYSHNFDVLTIL